VGGQEAYSEFQSSSHWLVSHSVNAQRLSLKDLVNKGKLLRSLVILLGIRLSVLH